MAQCDKISCQWNIEKEVVSNAARVSGVKLSKEQYYKYWCQNLRCELQGRTPLAVKKLWSQLWRVRTSLSVMKLGSRVWSIGKDKLVSNDVRILGVSRKFSSNKIIWKVMMPLSCGRWEQWRHLIVWNLKHWTRLNHNVFIHDNWGKKLCTPFSPNMF